MPGMTSTTAFPAFQPLTGFYEPSAIQQLADAGTDASFVVDEKKARKMLRKFRGSSCAL